MRYGCLQRERIVTDGRRMPPFWGVGGQKKATTGLVAAAQMCWVIKKPCQLRKVSHFIQSVKWLFVGLVTVLKPDIR